MNSRRWIVAGAICAAFVLGGILLRPRGPQQAAFQARELATRGLAEAVAKSSPGQRVLVISNPFTQRSDLPGPMRAMEDAGLRGLKAGFGPTAKLTIAFPELRPEAKHNPRAVAIDPESTTPLSFLVAENAFDQLAKQHPDCDVIVSLIGLPATLERVQCWKDAAGPRFALLLPDLRLIGNRSAIRAAMLRGKLAAVVLARPGAPETPPATEAPFADEFAKRFVLVTPPDVGAAMQAFPQLFPVN